MNRRGLSRQRKKKKKNKKKKKGKTKGRREAKCGRSFRKGVTRRQAQNITKRQTQEWAHNFGVHTINNNKHSCW